MKNNGIFKRATNYQEFDLALLNLSCDTFDLGDFIEKRYKEMSPQDEAPSQDLVLLERMQDNLLKVTDKYIKYDKSLSLIPIENINKELGLSIKDLSIKVYKAMHKITKAHLPEFPPHGPYSLLLNISNSLLKLRKILGNETLRPRGI